MSQLEHFERLAPRYDELRSPTTVTALHETLVHEADLTNKRVLDVGCGTGVHMAILAEYYGCEVVGVDPSPGMLACARAKLPAADLQRALAEELPFPNQAFDAALMTLVVHHVDRKRAFPEARRVLVSGGRFVISTPDPAAFARAWMAPLFPTYVDIERRRFPPAATLERDLRASGFASVGVRGLAVPRRFSREFALERIRGRHASTFQYMSDDEYRTGLERAERELPEVVEYLLEWTIVVARR